MPDKNKYTEAEARNIIRESIQKISGTFNKDIVSLVQATVMSVDEAANTCVVKPITGGSIAEIPGVKLSTEENDGFILIPEIDSTVMVATSTIHNYYVFSYSDIDKIICMANISIQFNKGEFGGLVKVAELTEKINNLETALSNLITLFNAHVHSGGTIMGSTGAPAVIDTDVITPTLQAEIENTSITHGI